MTISARKEIVMTTKHPMGFAITSNKTRPRQLSLHERQVLLTAEAARFRESMDSASHDDGWELARREVKAGLWRQISE